MNHRLLGLVAILGILAACTSVPLMTTPGADGGEPPPAAVRQEPAEVVPLVNAKGRWQPVAWSELPGFEQDALDEAWGAWVKSCERAAPVFAQVCPEVLRLSRAPAQEQRAWLQQRMQPYRVESLEGSAEGLLTGYYEPMLEAKRLPSESHSVPLYRPPADLSSRRPWYSRQEIDTLPQAREALRGREIAYLADPLEALSLQIQGSGRLRVTEPDGRQRWVRLSYAATNDHRYRSVGGWLLQQGELRDASWPGIKAWAARNPRRVNDMLWSNPRVVFFREEALPDTEAVLGPRGAQGVPLTPGRSIAVDKESIPYGTPVWLASSGAAVNLQRLVIAQDTGSAIVGAHRADYFVGWGPHAGEVAGRLKQPVKLWVLWPK